MATYITKADDTLGAIAAKNGTTVGALAALNGIKDVNKIGIGQTINLPSAPAAVTAPSSVINDYRNTLANVTANSTPAYIPPKTNLTYAAPVYNSQNMPLLQAPGSSGQPASTPAAPAAPAKPTPAAPSSTPANGSAATGAGNGTYVIKQGDNLSRIAAQFGTTVANLQALNGIKDPNLIIAGQSIKIGGATANPTGGANPSAALTNPANPPAPQTPDQVNADLATKAGAAGLSVDEYQKLMASQNAPTKAETDSIAKELGITALEGEAFKKPSQSSQQLFQTAYDTAGLSSLKEKINAINDSINIDRSNLTDATSAIDENPFLTETSRVGRGKRLLDQAESKINNKLAQIKQLQDLYDSGVTEINNMVTRNQTDFGANQAIDQAQLNYLVKKAEVQTTQLANSKSTSGTSAYLQSRTDSAKPDVIGNDNTGYFKYDQTLKKFVQVIAPSAKAGLDIQNQKLQNQKLAQDIANGGSGDGTFKPTADQKALANRATFADLKDTDGSPITFTPADRAKLATDPSFFYWVLQKANENGIY